MFDTLAGKLGGILDRLRGRGALSAADVAEAMREVRRALIEADVALEVTRGFIDRVLDLGCPSSPSLVQARASRPVLGTRLRGLRTP